MKLIKRIKDLIGIKQKEKPKISSTDVVGYDTSLVYIPKYKELTEEEKAQVDKYVKETDTTKIENVILYGTDMNKYSTGITELLLNVAYRVAEEKPIGRVNKLTTQEILNLRIDAMTKAEEMKFYEAVLRNLEREATLRTVALEQKYKKEKGNFRTFGVFEKAERIRRQNTEARFEAAIERMRISKKIIEQQIQTIMNSRVSNDKLAQTINIYKTLLKDVDTENQTREILEAKKQELLEMIKIVAPEKVSNIKESTDEESKIKDIARLQGILEIYAFTHKEDINQLRQRIQELDAVEKTDKNRDELLKELSDIRVKYKVFGRYIKDEDLEKLYKVKFDVLMLDINDQKESPLKEISDKRELECYKQIVEGKIEQILKGTNPHLKEAFGEEQLKNAISMIKQWIKGEQRTFQIENILQDRTLLSLILAFDNAQGIEKVSIDKEEVDTNLYENLFEWGSQIPVKGIWELRKLEETPITDEDKLYLILYNMYEENRQKDNDRNNTSAEFTYKRVSKIPDGIIQVKRLVDWERQNKVSANLGRSDKIIFPYTLKLIGERAFCSVCEPFNSLLDVEFNEGLEEIGYDAFRNCCNLGKYKTIELPSTLKIIGSSAFSECYNLHNIKLNEGLKEIGHHAFCCYPRQGKMRVLFLPSSVEKIGKVTHDTRTIKLVREEKRIRTLI